MHAFRRGASSAFQNVAAVQRRGYQQASSAYASTVKNLRINSDTKVIYQGFTGKQGTYVSIIYVLYDTDITIYFLILTLFTSRFHAEQAIAYGMVSSVAFT